MITGLRHIALVVLFAVMTTGAMAGVIRDDRDDLAYLTRGATYSTVGYVYGVQPAGAYSASGVLIDDDWVLTAGHVVDKATHLEITLGGATYTASRWMAYPKWTGLLSAGYDIGLMQLSTPVTGLTPAARFSGSNELEKTGIPVGFGKTGTGLTGAVSFDGLKRGGDNAVDAYYTSGRKTNNRILLADFDNPHNAADSAYGSATPLDLEIQTAPGDSGGGLFINGTLAGITSFYASFDGNTNGDYGDISGFTRVSAFNSWIDSVMAGTSGGGGKPPKPHGNSLSATDLGLEDWGMAFDARLIPAVSTVALPEPGIGLLLVGAGMLAIRRRK